VIGRGSETKNPLILVGERRKSLSATLGKLSFGSVILLRANGARAGMQMGC
jgi:hypothetical protein